MMLWNTNGTVGEWATMIYAPNQTGRRISFGKINSAGAPTLHSHITEGAYFDTDDWQLYVTGNVNAPDFVGTSDIRLKQNIKEYQPKKLNTVYKTFEFKNSPNQSRIGLIAQEVEVENPEFVRTSEDGTKSISYIDVHSAEISYLKSENERMIEEIEQLKEMLNMVLSKLKI